MTLRTFINTLFSLYASKEDEIGCVTCIGDEEIVQRILMGKSEFKKKVKNLKVDGSLRKELKE
jgi:hypothetical protein